MKILSGILLIVALLGGAIWWVGGMDAAEPIEIENPRIRLVPGDGPLAGYFTLTNHTDSSIRLVSVESEAFGRVMIHRTVIRDGAARMQHQDDGVRIGSGETVAFEPQGLHLMLMGAQRTFEVGDAVNLVLGFEGIEPAVLTVTFTVVPLTQS